MTDFTPITADQVVRKLAVDDKFAVNCLLQLYACQTADEQQAETTTYRNGVGFNGADAGILSSFAQQAEARRAQRKAGEIPAHWTDLSPKQMALLRSKLTKYQRQLTELTNNALRRKAEHEEARAAEVRDAVKLDAIADCIFGKVETVYHPLPAHPRRTEPTEDYLPTYEEYEPLPEEAVRHLWNEMPAICHAVTTPLPERNGFDAPSCRLIQNGANLRFPTAKDLAEGGMDSGLRQLQQSMTVGTVLQHRSGRDDLAGYNAADDPFAE